MKNRLLRVEFEGKLQTENGYEDVKRKAIVSIPVERVDEMEDDELLEIMEEPFMDDFILNPDVVEGTTNIISDNVKAENTENVKRSIYSYDDNYDISIDDIEGILSVLNLPEGFENKKWYCISSEYGEFTEEEKEKFKKFDITLNTYLYVSREVVE